MRSGPAPVDASGHSCAMIVRTRTLTMAVNPNARWPTRNWTISTTPDLEFATISIVGSKARALYCGRACAQSPHVQPPRRDPAMGRKHVTDRQLEGQNAMGHV